MLELLLLAMLDMLLCRWLDGAHLLHAAAAARLPSACCQLIGTRSLTMAAPAAPFSRSVQSKLQLSHRYCAAHALPKAQRR
jgi:hypothetical protein